MFSLPGDRPPEAYIFDKVIERLDEVAARLTVSMQLPSSEQERVKRVVREKGLTNSDRHIIYEQIGEALDFTSGYIVSGAFLAVWAQEYPKEVEDFALAFGSELPTAGRLAIPASAPHS